MTREFCTLFDINYLPRGLVLYHSLERTCPDFRLRVFCMDTESEKLLARLSLPRLTIVPLAELEQHDLLLAAVKPDRTQVEYCWTATPAICLYSLETDAELTEITYLDADIMFFSDPELLFAELGGGAVMIVPHRYAPEHRWQEVESGIYNVEWLTFRRDDDGLAVLRWWHARCIEWCYARFEDGKMGDQLYLDDWSERFDRIHILEHPGGGLAPWNVTNHRLEAHAGRVLVDGRPLVFYHFHSLRLYHRTPTARAATAAGHLRPGVEPVALPWSSNYHVSPTERRLVWEPYLSALGEELNALKSVGGATFPGVQTLPPGEFGRRAAHAAARRGKAIALRAGRRMNPVRWAALRFPLYRDSWRSRDVAAQMVELTERELERVDAIPPYRSFKELLERLTADAALPQRARLLDIGCGAGAYGELLDRWAPGRFEYVGADYAEEIVEVARARSPERRFVRCDVFEPGALDGYDVVLASALVDVLADYERALAVLLAADAPWLLLHRQRIDDRVRAEVAPGYSGQTTYRSYLTREYLEAVAAAHGRRIVSSVSVDGDVHSFLIVRS